MSRKKIKNPLIKRIPKEIIGDWKKYLVVFLFLVLTIGFVSGMYVANDSMLTSADEGVSKYKQEDGHFELKDKADSELVTAINPYDLIITDMYYPDEPGGREEQSGDVLIDRVIKNKITIPVILCSSVNLKYPEIYGCVYYSRERNWEADMQTLVNSLVAG